VNTGGIVGAIVNDRNLKLSNATMDGQIVSKFNDSTGGCQVGGVIGSLFSNAQANLSNVTF
jgi:hypothetical protein